MDSLETWITDIKYYHNVEDFNINLMADEDRHVSHLFGLIEPTIRDSYTGIPYPCRGLFIIDPDKVLSMMSLYPWSVGRNISEIIRVVDSLQLTRLYKNSVSIAFLIVYTRVAPARRVLVQGVGRVWYKVCKSMVQGVTKSGTRCYKVWYKV